MGKITIKKSELDKIIKEEALKFRKALSLKKELGNVEKELKQLNEVEAGAEIESPGKPFQGKQHKANFHNPAKNPHTMMEDETEDINDTEIDTDVDSDVDTNSDTIDKAAVLSAIEDLKMALNLHGVSDVNSEEEESEESTENNGEEIGDDDQEFEFDSEDGENEENEEGSEDEEEIEEGGYNETHQDEKGNIVNADDVQENLEEPMKGKSVVQNAEEDSVNDNMEKDTRVKASGDTLMESEKRRMAILAGIVKG